MGSLARVEPDGIGWQPAGVRVPELRPDTIHVWRVAIDGNEDAALVDARRALLATEEVDRAARFRVRALRHRFVLCRAALRCLLGGYLDVDPRSVALEYGAFGKPVLAGRWRSAPALEFNVSHCEDLALVAVARHRPVGVDVERVRLLPDADRLASRFFAPGEQAQYAALPNEWRALGFFQCWTRKEAFIKATGEGLSRSLKDFEVSLSPGSPPRVLQVAGSEPAAWFLSSFQPATGFTAAVAAVGGPATISFFESTPAGLL